MLFLVRQMLMIAPQGLKIGPAVLEPTVWRKATVKIRRNPLLRFLFLWKTHNNYYENENYINFTIFCLIQILLLILIFILLTTSIFILIWNTKLSLATLLSTINLNFIFYWGSNFNWTIRLIPTIVYNSNQK